jgi:3-oxoacyl-[acyl-carrier-protein] synthase II
MKTTKYAHWTHRDPTPEANRRVVITGLGAVSAVGVGVAELWESLLSGKSGIDTITRFDTTGMSSQIGGEVKNFNAQHLLGSRLRPKRLSRQAQFALVAGKEAVADAGLDEAALQRRKCGVVLGSALYNAEEIATHALQIEDRGVGSMRATALPLISVQSQAAAMTEMFRLENTPAFCVSTACMSGVTAIATGCSMIESGECDLVICGGTDALSMCPAAELIQAGLCSTRNEEPARASRPFDRERENGLMAEGAGVIVLESFEAAAARKAEPYAELIGDHACRDPEGSASGGGLAQTMQTALDNAGCAPENVDYISAWGCGDPDFDRMETEAIKQVFGAHAYRLAVSSIKAVVGNPLGAAAALQVIAGAMSLRHHLLPPTANYDHHDLDCDLDYIMGRPRRVRARNLLVNAHGLGGGNGCLVMSALRKM